MTTTFWQESTEARKQIIERGETAYAGLKETERKYKERLGELTGTLERFGVTDTDQFLSQFPAKGGSLNDQITAFATEQGEAGVTMNELASQFKTVPDHVVFRAASNLIEAKKLKETKLERNGQIVFVKAK